MGPSDPNLASVSDWTVTSISFIFLLIMEPLSLAAHVIPSLEIFLSSKQRVWPHGKSLLVNVSRSDIHNFWIFWWKAEQLHWIRGGSTSWCRQSPFISLRSLLFGLTWDSTPFWSHFPMGSASQNLPWTYQVLNWSINICGLVWITYMTINILALLSWAFTQLPKTGLLCKEGNRSTMLCRKI